MIDQMYETATQTKITPVMGFVLQNYQNQLAATADPLMIGGGSSGTYSHDIYLESPDLSSVSAWQNISGYSIDIQRTLAGACGEPGGIKFYAQLQIRVIDMTDQSTHLFAEYDGTDYVFHTIEYSTSYHFVWNPSWLSDPKYKVKQVRIRLMGAHDYGSGECAAKGSWLIDNVCAETRSESLTLTSPNGAENWQVGSSHNITWTSQNFSNPVKIEYSIDNGSNYTTIVSSTPNDGSYEWTIPNNRSASCYVRISDASDGNPSDENDNSFTISDPTQWLTVTSPNGGEVWQVETQYEIKWSSSGFSDPISIDFLSSNSRLSIVQSTPNDGSFNWTIPNIFTLPENGKIRIADASRDIPIDLSDAEFTIVQVAANNTQPGTNVNVNLGNGSAITFDNATTSGNTAMTTSQTGTPPPNGFTITPAANPTYYNITTTATYSGKIKICIHYDDTGLTPAQEAALKLNVHENSQWVDITTSLDVNANIICGEVTHLSEFAVMYGSNPAAPSHFVFASNTGNSYSIVIDAATLDGKSLAVGDEIGVFTPAGLCAGASVWDGNTPLALTAWGDNTQTTDMDGFVAGEQMTFKVWDHAADAEYEASPTYSQGNGTFANGAYAQILALTALSSVTETLALTQGWSWISLQITPPDLSASAVFGSVTSLAIVVTNAGQFYIPNVIDNIGQLNLLEGYKVYLNLAESFSATGQPIKPETPIPLTLGWNFVSYLPTAPMPTEQALGSIISSLAIVKTDDGTFFIPGVISNLPALSPGKGYKLYLNTVDTLVYPRSSGLLKAGSPVFSGVNRATKHFVSCARTGDSYSVVVRSVQLEGEQPHIGDEIGIFTESGLCVGAASWSGRGSLGIAAWKNDPRTDRIDGFRSGEPMIFKFWDAKKQQEMILHPGFSKGDGQFETGAFASVDLSAESVPGTFALYQNYPNPFNSETLIVFDLPQDEKVELKIFNLEGVEIRTLVQNLTLHAGSHQFRWDGLDEKGRAVSSGIYLYRLKTTSSVLIKKATLIK